MMVEGMGIEGGVRYKGTSVDIPECGLSIAGDAASGTFNASLLSERSRGAALLATLLLHLLSRWRSHALVWGARLLHTVAVVFL